MDHGMQIVVLDRGFVFVGNVVTDTTWCIITRAKSIRRWGTTKGLGQLAAEGPRPETVLDMGGTVRAPMSSVVAMLACEVTAWPSE